MTDKMNPEVKALWIDALRSDEYEQGNGLLRSENNKFCCLGVLQDLAVKAGIIPEGTLVSGAYEYETTDNGKSATGTTPSVNVWAGLDSVSGLLPNAVQLEEGGSSTSLVALNDGARYTFSQIADVIEEQF